mmetsp:Transcript_1505/g.5127  ORF Transcript_1505/g.5127 Transcript_1505/m.5127 type:complete len:464 (-) Transcript_1505:159-1550(-)
MVFPGRIHCRGGHGEQRHGVERRGRCCHHRQLGPCASGQVPSHREGDPHAQAPPPRQVAAAALHHPRADPVREHLDPCGFGAEHVGTLDHQPLRRVLLVLDRKGVGAALVGGGAPHHGQGPGRAVRDIAALVHDAVHPGVHAGVPRELPREALHRRRPLRRDRRVLLLRQQHHVRHDPAERSHSFADVAKVPPPQVPEGEPYRYRALCQDHQVHRLGGGGAPAAHDPGKSRPPQAAVGPPDHLPPEGGALTNSRGAPALPAVRLEQPVSHQPALLHGGLEAVPVQGRHCIRCERGGVVHVLPGLGLALLQADEDELSREADHPDHAGHVVHRVRVVGALGPLGLRQGDHRERNPNDPVVRFPRRHAVVPHGCAVCASCRDGAPEVARGERGQGGGLGHPPAVARPRQARGGRRHARRGDRRRRGLGGANDGQHLLGVIRGRGGGGGVPDTRDEAELDELGLRC